MSIHFADLILDPNNNTYDAAYADEKYPDPEIDPNSNGVRDKRLVSPDINLSDFVLFIDKGYIVDSGFTHKANANKRISSKQALFYARGAYMSWLHSQLSKKILSYDEVITAERTRMDSERRAWSAAGIEGSPSSEWLISNIRNRSSTILLQTKLEEEWDRCFETDIVAAFEALASKPVVRSNSERKVHINPIHIHMEQWVNANTNDPQHCFQFRSLDKSKSYSEIVNENKWQMSDDAMENNAVDLLLAVKDIMNGGIDRAVQNKLLTMAMSFIANPCTMFDTLAMNVSIMGPPGTGKSTIAKCFSKFAYCLGWITSPKLVETTKSTLISYEQGKTSLKCRDFFNGHIGQAIFMDEAYSYTQGEPGQEFADELTAFLTEHKGLIMVIVAGYVNEMRDDFFQSNIGLPRRFPSLVQMREKTDRQLFAAFMAQYDKRKTINGKKYGPIQSIAEYFNSNYPHMEVTATWLPILYLLKRTRIVDEPRTGVNMLSAYYADVTEIAIAYHSLMEQDALLLKTLFNGQRQLYNTLRKPGRSYEIDKNEVIRLSLTQWFQNKAFMLGIENGTCTVTTESSIAHVFESDSFVQKVLNKMKNDPEKILQGIIDLVWDSASNNNFNDEYSDSKAICITLIDYNKDEKKLYVRVAGGSCTISARGVRNGTTQPAVLNRVGPRWTWISDREAVKNALNRIVS